MGAGSSSTVPSDRASSIVSVLADIPNGPGDVWSIVIASVVFAALFLFLKLLERV